MSKCVRVTFTLSYLVPNEPEFIDMAKENIIEDVIDAYRCGEIPFHIEVKESDEPESEVSSYFYELSNLSRTEDD